MTSKGGLRVVRGRGAGILEIPTKDKGILQYFTSLSGMREFADGERNYIFFNPRSGFAVGKSNVIKKRFNGG